MGVPAPQFMMEVKRATYKMILSSDGIIKYGLLYNQLVIPCLPNSSNFVVLQKYNVIYHEMSGETRAVPTKEYCLTLEKDVKKDDFFKKFYYTPKVLVKDFDLNVLLGEKTQTFFKEKYKEIYNKISKQQKEDFSYALLVELNENKSDFSPTKLKMFIEIVLLSCIKKSSLVNKDILYNIIKNASIKEDVMYYCFFPKLCYYIYNYSSFSKDIQYKINDFIDSLILRLNNTDTSKLITNIDLEILCKALEKREAI